MTFDFVQVKNSEHIKLTDVDGELTIYSYHDCNEESPDFIKQCRGIVIRGDELIVKTFDYTPEYNENEIDKIRSKLVNSSSYQVFESLEGCMVRLFFHNNKWFLSTQKKLDAFRSRWICKESFGELFVKGLEYEYHNSDSFKEKVGEIERMDDLYQKFLFSLNPEHVYIFFIKNNNQNRLVNNADNIPKIYHIGTYLERTNFVLDFDISLPSPKRLSFEDVDEMVEYVLNIDYFTSQGLMVFSEDGRQFKIVNSKYQDYLRVRGNDPLVVRRYLAIRNNKEDKSKLLELYPEMGNTFFKVEATLDIISMNILKAYVRRFIKKEYTVVSPQEFQVIKECHSWHLADKDNNKISLNKVKEVLNSQSSFNLYKIIEKVF
jgi:hypothetical protein